MSVWKHVLHCGVAFWNRDISTKIISWTHYYGHYWEITFGHSSPVWSCVVHWSMQLAYRRDTAAGTRLFYRLPGLEARTANSRLVSPANVRRKDKWCRGIKTRFHLNIPGCRQASTSVFRPRDRVDLCRFFCSPACCTIYDEQCC